MLALTASAPADEIVLHDNGMTPDGVTGSPIGSPMVPTVVSAEDFVVPEGDVWTVTGLRYVLSPGVGMEEGPVVAVRVCTDSGGEGPLSPIYHATLPFTREYIGDYFGRPAYEYTVGGFELQLTPGVYWTSPAFPRASQEGYATWLTARVDDLAQQRDLGWWSPDGMETWFRMNELGWEGDYWHHAFAVLGRRDGPPLPERTEDNEREALGLGDSLDDGRSRGLKPAARETPAARDSLWEVEDDSSDTLETTPLDGPVASGDLLWDNELTPSGVMARAISPPAFPNIRVADDFVVPPEGWTIRSTHLNVIEDTGWTHGGLLTVFVYEDTGNGPGRAIHTETGPFVRMATGDVYFGRPGFDYWYEGLEIEIAEGSYWIGFQNPAGGGAGTNYWQISDAGPDGINSSTGWFSLNSGDTWTPEGDTWHHAFEIRGEQGIGSIALPQRFEVTRGVRVAGGLLSLTASDDDYMRIEARRPSAVSQPSVQVVVESAVGSDPARRITFTLEAATSIRDLIQWIDFYDFDDDRWRRMDTRTATTGDSVTVVTEADDPDRFVDDETGIVRARVSFWDFGSPIARWSGRIDRTTWRVLR
jgi:hypothetical protein